MATKEILFNNKIKEFLDKHDMKQNILAERVGVSKQSIGAIVNEKSNPSLDTAMKIAKVLGTTVEEIFQLKNE